MGRGLPIGTVAACLWREEKGFGRKKGKQQVVRGPPLHNFRGFTVVRAGFRTPGRWFGR